jgi:hypothetical protein
MKLFEESTLDNKTLFYYFVIFIAITFAFSTIKLGLNIIYGTIIAYFIINFLYSNYKKKQETENKTKSFQEANLLPKPKIFEKYGDIIKYLFSIQDFYIYNPQAYEDMTKSLDSFFRTYEETKNNSSQSGVNHGLMINYKRSATNSLHSIIYNLPNDVDYTNKLNDAIIIIQEILDKYLDKVKLINKKYLFENGYNNKTKIIDNLELPYNSFDNGVKSLFTFDLF